MFVDNEDDEVEGKRFSKIQVFAKVFWFVEEQRQPVFLTKYRFLATTNRCWQLPFNPYL